MALLFSPASGYSTMAEETKDSHFLQNDIVSIGGTYRLRGEVQDGYNVKTYGTGTKEDFLISRLRLEIDLHLSQKIHFFTEIQDAEVLGLSFRDRDFSGKNNPYHDPADINKVFIAYKPLEEIEIKVGRQAILFGDRRIFGPGDWGNTGRWAWDAVLIHFNNDYFESTWLAGRPFIHDPDQWPNKISSGPTAYATYNTIKGLPFLFDLFYVLKSDDRNITKGEKGTGDLNSHTIGFRIDGKYMQWDYNSTVARQFGRWGPDRIDAYGLVFNLGYSFNTIWKPHIAVRYIVGSGDKNPDDGRHGTFDGVFGGADRDLYSWMQLFFWSNLREPSLHLTLKPREDLTLLTEYRYFMLDEAKDAWYFPGNAQRRDKTGSSGRELGHEVDLIAKKKISEYLEILAGYSFFIPGKFVKNTGPSPTAHWCFLQTTVFF